MGRPPSRTSHRTLVPTTVCALSVSIGGAVSHSWTSTWQNRLATRDGSPFPRRADLGVARRHDGRFTGPGHAGRSLRARQSPAPRLGRPMIGATSASRTPTALRRRSTAALGTVIVCAAIAALVSAGGGGGGSPPRAPRAWPTTTSARPATAPSATAAPTPARASRCRRPTTTPRALTADCDVGYRCSATARRLALGPHRRRAASASANGSSANGSSANGSSATAAATSEQQRERIAAQQHRRQRRRRRRRRRGRRGRRRGVDADARLGAARPAARASCRCA